MYSVLEGLHKALGTGHLKNFDLLVDTQPLRWMIAIVGHQVAPGTRHVPESFKKGLSEALTDEKWKDGPVTSQDVRGFQQDLSQVSTLMEEVKQTVDSFGSDILDKFVVLADKRAQDSIATNDKRAQDLKDGADKRVQESDKRVQDSKDGADKRVQDSIDVTDKRVHDSIDVQTLLRTDLKAERKENKASEVKLALRDRDLQQVNSTLDQTQEELKQAKADLAKVNADLAKVNADHPAAMKKAEKWDKARKRFRSELREFGCNDITDLVQKYKRDLEKQHSATKNKAGQWTESRYNSTSGQPHKRARTVYNTVRKTVRKTIRKHY